MNSQGFLSIAAQNARIQSDDPHTQNGAIIVVGDTIYARGSNFFPYRIEGSEERKQSPLKYSYLLHAEQAAIADAARNGFSTLDSTMYVLWACCSTCAKLIINAGIMKVVTSAKLYTLTPARWQDEVNLGLALLQEAGVQVERIADIGVETLFDGSLIRI